MTFDIKNRIVLLPHARFAETHVLFVLLRLLVRRQRRRRHVDCEFACKPFAYPFHRHRRQQLCITLFKKQTNNTRYRISLRDMRHAEYYYASE